MTNTHLLGRFVDGLDDDAFYVGPDPQTEPERHGQFNLIDLTSTWKVDLIILPPGIYDRVAFERRVRATSVDVEIWVASAAARPSTPVGDGLNRR